MLCFFQLNWNYLTRSNLTIRPAHLFLVLFSFQGSCLRLPHLTTCTVYYNFISESSTFLNYFSAHSVALTRRLIYNIRFYALWQPPCGSLFEILSIYRPLKIYLLYINLIIKWGAFCLTSFDNLYIIVMIFSNTRVVLYPKKIRLPYIIDIR